MRVDFVRVAVATLLNREVGQAEAVQLTKELGNREELLAWLLLHHGAALQGTALMRSLAAQAQPAFERSAGPARVRRTQAEAVAMAALEAEITQLIEADQAADSPVQKAISALGDYGCSRPDGSPTLVDMAVRR